MSTEKLKQKITFSRTERNGKPFVIAGPCSAETEEQVMETVEALAKTGKIDTIRAGIWKPRTRPGTFEGIGNVGLKWIKEAGEKVGLPVTVEVANAKHVYESLKHGIDFLWIGARTTVNPFAVQEIADALEGVNVPVMIKNPVNTDLELWIGAIERVRKAGIKQIVAIHRGFSTYEQSKYRNKPYWEIPIELKRRMPEIPIICDPSHICGSREFLQHISQKAIDLNFDGLMIETHIDPTNAWSDAKQQVTPSVLAEMIDNLILRELSTTDRDFNQYLEELRTEIDTIDHQIIDILCERMKIVTEIGKCKKENNVTILQPGRWDEIVKDRLESGVKKGLTREFVNQLFQSVHQASISKQTEIMNDE